MKTLFLMRHAKSSWKHPELADAERGLAKRGKKEAPLMGSLLKKRKLVPQVMLCSSAERARQTAQAVVESSHYQGEVTYQDALYMADAAQYLAALSALPEDAESVMIIGHNPGLEELLQRLTGRIEALTTGTVAIIKLPVKNWAELTDQVEAELKDVISPKMLEGLEKDEKKEKHGKQADKKKKSKEKKK